MKKTYTLKLVKHDWGTWFQSGDLEPCAKGLAELFDLPRGCKEVDVIVQTTKPRGSNYHVVSVGFYGSSVLKHDDGDTLFTMPVDLELKRFGANRLYVSVYA